jgi:hypothetical protein
VFCNAVCTGCAYEGDGTALKQCFSLDESHSFFLQDTNDPCTGDAYASQADYFLTRYQPNSCTPSPNTTQTSIIAIGQPTATGECTSYSVKPGKTAYFKFQSHNATGFDVSLDCRDSNCSQCAFNLSHVSDGQCNANVNVSFVFSKGLEQCVEPPKGKSENWRPIVGGVLGGVALLTIIVVIVVKRRIFQREAQDLQTTASITKRTCASRVPYCLDSLWNMISGRLSKNLCEPTLC